MKCRMQRLRRLHSAKYRSIGTLITVVFVVSCLACTVGGAEFKPNIYVPYEDLAHLIDPADKAVLMNRAEFEELLAVAEANAKEADTLELGQVKNAEYSAEVTGERVALTGKLKVVSMSKKPVAIPLGFGQLGLTKVVLDGEAAPLGYNKQGKLTLIVTAKGSHELEIAGTSRLKELSTGGMQLSISLPETVAGSMKFGAPGDLEIHATVPQSKRVYDRETDRTSIELTIGGKNALSVVLLGNGRREDNEAVLLGESAATVSLTRSHQELGCLYTVQVLRRGVRQLQFQLPTQWTVTEVTCPSLVRWSVEEASPSSKTLSVRLRSGKVGTVALHIKATAERKAEAWQSPRVLLVDAAYQRGYLMVNTSEGLGVRGERVTSARREDISAVGSVAGLVGGTGARLYFHWGENWSVDLELATVALRRSIKERQKIVVSPKQVALTGEFEVTAIERELFDMAFVLGAQAEQWQIRTVQVDEKETGFEYRIEESTNGRLLKIELSRPIRPEKMANVRIVLQYVPSNWNWAGDAAERSIAVPLIGSQAEDVSGHISVSAVGDLDALPSKVPDELEVVPVGRMASLGMRRDIQHAYSYNEALRGQVQLEVSRRSPRLSSEAIGLLSINPREFTGDWRITYTISRASAKKLYVLVDKSLGQEIRITSALPISSKGIVTAGEKTMPLSGELSQQYNLWLLTLDHKATGNVAIDVHYERPVTERTLRVPLVRPICKGQINEQLAIQGSEELALTIEAERAKEVDAIDLPALPVAASRILAAFRLDAPTSAKGAEAAVRLETAVHKSYEIPSALAVSAELTTYLGIQGGQRTEASLRVANAGKQFLTMRLPEGTELWSLRVNNRQVKPQRSAQGDYQVALGQLGKPAEVRIVYAYEPANVNLERIDLGGVELPGVRMNEMSWTVVPPPGYRITKQETRMQTHDIVRPMPAYVRAYEILRDNVFFGSVLMTSLGKAQKVQYAAIRADRLSSESEKAGLRMRGGAAARAPLRPPPPREAPAPTQQGSRPVSRRDLGVRLASAGRFTLPVDIVPTAGAGPRARFTGLGTAKLTVGLTSRSWESGLWLLGFVLIAAIGIALTQRGAKAKAILIVVVLSFASLLALWWPVTTYFANGFFVAAVCLIPLYVLICFVRWLSCRLQSGGAIGGGSATVVTLLALALYIGCSAQVAQAEPVAKVRQAGPSPTTQQQSQQGKVAAASIKQGPKKMFLPAIIPYEGDPTTAEGADKVLIPYTRFVKLWNQAHPEDPIDGLKPGTDISLAAVRYKVTVSAEQLELLLTADIRTYGKDWVVLPLPISGLAVTDATLNGKPARLQTGPKGTVLMLAGRTSGQLQLRAVAKPHYLGRRGSASFELPPLPGAIMTVVLPEEDLELEIDEAEGVLTKHEVNGAVEWVVGLGMARKLTLRWLPKLGGGAADRTLSASSTHDVYAFHWAIVGVSNIRYSFSSGERDRFSLLLPEGATVTDLKGTNIRDYREAGEKTIEGKTFTVVEVRLHRPAKKQYDLTIRWLGELPALENPQRLFLVRAGDVSRESGTVTLHSAGGIAIKLTEVSGGRRTSVAESGDSRDVELTCDRAKAVARYYWPYRPFALFVQLSRLMAKPKVHLDQLVRISTDRVELLVQANLKAEQGRLFGASFVLPEGYELLSAVGPAVENFYERSNVKGKFVHIKFHGGEREAKIALVLVRRKAQFEDFSVPTITYIDPVGHEAVKQQGRVAVQVAASLEAETVASENLKAIAPPALKGWLDDRQIGSVQFAYRYEVANPVLRLNIRRLPMQVRVEIFAGLVVRSTVAAYTYRLRYNIGGSPVDRLSFQLPSEYAPLVAVESPAMRSVAQSDAGDDKTRWDVALINEVTGLVDVVVNFALPIDASTKVLPMPRIETDAPAGYRAIVVVQNMSRHDIDVKDRTELTELAVSEQQKLMPREMRESLQYVFQSFEEKWSLGLDLKPAKMAARIQAVVDLLSLTTVIDRNGRCRYEARVALQNRSEQFLRVKVPEGLRLWSAKVADQPVKPARPTSSREEEVLIPLVKTSPGGLPYDVHLFFASESDKPLVEPLNGLTKLKPPGISIIGIPVMRTTWSLRLPGGYRYVRPSGNMSPVAGTVEVMSLGIEAKLEQLKRLEKTYRDVAGSSSHREQIAGRNWEVFNEKLREDIRQAESHLDTYRGQVSDEEYQRLKSKIGGQIRVQTDIVGDNTAFIQRQQKLTSNDMNRFLNASISNAGVAEIARNDALFSMPDFVGQSEQQQIVRLQQELELSEQQLKVVSGAYGRPKPKDAKVFRDAAKEGGESAQKLIAGDVDKKAEVDEILTGLARESAVQIGQKQMQLRNQLEELADSRLQRHFRQDFDRVKADQAAAEKAPRLQGRGGYAYDVQQRQAEPQARIRPRRTEIPAADLLGLGTEVTAPGGPVTAAVSAGAPYKPLAGPGEVQPYVAKGVYSLPVTLPEGEVRLDFARPSGEAELSILAIPTSTIRSLYATLAVTVATLVALGLIKIWPQVDMRHPMSAKRIAVYLLVLVVLTCILGLLGLVIGVLAILLSEAKSRRVRLAVH